MTEGAAGGGEPTFLSDLTDLADEFAVTEERCELAAFVVDRTARQSAYFVYPDGRVVLPAPAWEALREAAREEEPQRTSLSPARRSLLGVPVRFEDGAWGEAVAEYRLWRRMKDQEEELT